MFIYGLPMISLSLAAAALVSLTFFLFNYVVFMLGDISLTFIANILVKIWSGPVRPPKQGIWTYIRRNSTSASDKILKLAIQDRACSHLSTFYWKLLGSYFGALEHQKRLSKDFFPQKFSFLNV